MQEDQEWEDLQNFSVIFAKNQVILQTDALKILTMQILLHLEINHLQNIIVIFAIGMAIPLIDVLKIKKNSEGGGGGFQSGLGSKPPSKYYCDICQKPGHSSDRCYKNPQNAQPQGMFGSPFGPSDPFGGKMQGPSKYFCEICNKSGHTADRCFKNPQNSGMTSGPQRSTIVRCQACGGAGHSAESCLNAIQGDNKGYSGFPMIQDPNESD